MKYSSLDINAMSWAEWTATMAKELNEAGYRTRGYNEEIGGWQDNYALFQEDVSDPKFFILGAVDGSAEISYLKSLGLLNNGRCPSCGNRIVGSPGRFTSGYNSSVHFHICQNCIVKGQEISVNNANNIGCIISIVLLPWHILKSIF